VDPAAILARGVPRGQGAEAFAREEVRHGIGREARAGFEVRAQLARAEQRRPVRDGARRGPRNACALGHGGGGRGLHLGHAGPGKRAGEPQATPGREHGSIGREEARLDAGGRADPRGAQTRVGRSFAAVAHAQVRLDRTRGVDERPRNESARQPAARPDDEQRARGTFGEEHGRGVRGADFPDAADAGAHEFAADFHLEDLEALDVTAVAHGATQAPEFRVERAQDQDGGHPKEHGERRAFAQQCGIRGRRIRSREAGSPRAERPRKSCEDRRTLA